MVVTWMANILVYFLFLLLDRKKKEKDKKKSSKPKGPVRRQMISEDMYVIIYNQLNKTTIIT